MELAVCRHCVVVPHVVARFPSVSPELTVRVPPDAGQAVPCQACYRAEYHHQLPRCIDQIGSHAGWALVADEHIHQAFGGPSTQAVQQAQVATDVARCDVAKII